MNIFRKLMLSMLFFYTIAQAEEVNILTAKGEIPLKLMPQKIAVLDLSALDTLDALGIPIGATINNQFNIDYLVKAAKGSIDAGGIFSPDIEALNLYQPDLVILGPTSTRHYEEIKKYFPNTIDMTINDLDPYGEGLSRLKSYGKLFNKTNEANTISNDIEQLVKATQLLSKNQGKGLILSVTGKQLSALSQQSSVGWIHSLLGIEQADKDIVYSSHGQPVSFEYVNKINPDWLFVLDRGTAIGSGGEAAEVVLDNPLVKQTTAWKKGQIVYFSAAAYLAPGGVRQIEGDVSTIKAAFEK